ncbi:MAG: hypothetical protein ABSF84_15775 [Acidimicrobiales bacterium]
MASVISDGIGFCAVASSGGLDRWGNGTLGQLGNGTRYVSGGRGSAVPVAVVGPDDVGTLSAVAGAVGEGDGFCALLDSEAVDYWGVDTDGQLGNGIVYQPGKQGSDIPVAVDDVGREPHRPATLPTSAPPDAGSGIGRPGCYLVSFTSPQ